MSAERDVAVPGGRILRVHDTGGAGRGRATVLWHHGSPQTGALLDPLVEATGRRGIRLVSYGRPSYGGSTPDPGRTVASAAGDVARIADALGLARFAVMGASGGGPHALACAALLPERVGSAACLGGIAPVTSDIPWFDGMVAPGGLRAAQEGRDARVRYAETAEFDEESFTAADWAALAAGGTWESLGDDAQRAGIASPDGLIDDDVALVSPWGFDPASIAAPALFVQGGEDRVVPPAHAEWLAQTCPRSERWLRPRDGHISVLEAVRLALDWLLDPAV